MLTTEGLVDPKTTEIDDDQDEILLLYETPPSLNKGKGKIGEIVDDNDEEDEEEVQVLFATSWSKGKNKRKQSDTHNDDDDDEISVLYATPSSKESKKLSEISVDKGRRAERDMIVDLSQNYPLEYDDEVQFIYSFPRPKKTFIGESSNSKPDQAQESADKEAGAPGDSPLIMCEICVDEKPEREFFPIWGCMHSFCSDCVAKYVASKLQENVTSITCPVPGCEGLLGPELCRSILPSQVFDRWGKALCEELILPSQRFYCPYKDCSALMVDDTGETGEVMSQMACPNCQRMFCVQCRVPWHSGIDCSEFQMLNEGEIGKEDIMLMNLAKKNLWKRCPNCKMYVQRTQGCNNMLCRCGCGFCYGCGSPLQSCFCFRNQTPNRVLYIPFPWDGLDRTSYTRDHVESRSTEQTPSNLFSMSQLHQPRPHAYVVNRSAHQVQHNLDQLRTSYTRNQFTVNPSARQMQNNLDQLRTSYTPNQLVNPSAGQMQQHLAQLRTSNTPNQFVNPSASQMQHNLDQLRTSYTPNQLVNPSASQMQHNLDQLRTSYTPNQLVNPSASQMQHNLDQFRTSYPPNQLVNPSASQMQHNLDQFRTSYTPNQLENPSAGQMQNNLEQLSTSPTHPVLDQLMRFHGLRNG